MRTDAARNRERLVAATVELILEVGGEPTRDAIAERSGFGIGTVYRHFPDRQSLLHAVARHVLEATIGAGEDIVATDVDGVDALRQYLHSAIDHGIGVVNMIHPLIDVADWPDLTARAAALLTTLVERTQQGRDRPVDLTVADIVHATIRFGRPLAIGLPRQEDRLIAHRQLDRYVDGLCRPDPPAR